MAQRTLVAVASHADDAEINAGGFMARWAAEGGAVHIVMVTNNCSGEIIQADGDESKIHRLLPQQTTELRHREQQAAADVIGARVHHLGYCQRHFFNGKKIVRLDFQDVEAPEGIKGHPPLLIAFQQPPHIARLADLLVSLKPDLVLTQTPLDFDPEHHATASMVWEAMRQRPQLSKVPLKFWTPGTTCPGGMLDPGYDQIEDVTAWWETKLRLCACHASQMTALRWKVVKDRAAEFGRKIGVRFAEPFKSAIR